MSVFAHVDRVLQEYHKQNDIRVVPISVDKLRVCFQNLGYVDNIICEQVNLKTEHILAQIKTYSAGRGKYPDVGTYARIQLSILDDLPWRRFILCKEMYHLMLDADPRNQVSNTKELLKLGEHLTNSFLEYVQTSQEHFPPFETEKTAEFLAIETLFPLELRTTFRDRYDEGHLTGQQLSLRFLVPEDYIHTAMNHSYCDAIANLRVPIPLD